MTRPRPNLNGKSPLSEMITESTKCKYGDVATSHLSTDHGCVMAVAEASGDTPEDMGLDPRRRE